jgi:hypothetical protein
MKIQFIMPCVGNERVKSAIDTLGKTGKIANLPIYNAQHGVATFTMIVARNYKSELIAFATNISGWSDQYFVRRIPKEYRRRRWSIETTFRKMKEVVGKTTSTLPELRLIYFMMAMFLYNIWQVVNYCFLSRGRTYRFDEEDNSDDFCADKVLRQLSDTDENNIVSDGTGLSKMSFIHRLFCVFQPS